MNVFLSLDEVTMVFAEYVNNHYSQYDFDGWKVDQSGKSAVFQLDLIPKESGKIRKSSFDKNDKPGYKNASR